MEDYNTTLLLNGYFDNLESIQLPNSLTCLYFGRLFNQPIDNIKWPKSITTLYISYIFDQPLDFLPETIKIVKINKRNKSSVLRQSLFLLPHETIVEYGDYVFT